jgi:pilus assembly protein CpaF
MELITTLENFFLDDQVDEVLVNGTRSLEIVGADGRIVRRSPYSDVTDLIRKIQEFAFSQDMRLDPFSPAAGGILGEREMRWHAVIPPACPNSALFSLRRHRFDSLKLTDFYFAPETEFQIRNLFQTRRPLLICGPTGSGKTSLLTCLLREYCRDERVFILESIKEMPLSGDCWARLTSKGPGRDGRGALTLEYLFSESLRLRPDRIVIGELRHREIVSFASSLSAGHRGVASTLHASSVADVRLRFKLILTAVGIDVFAAESLLRDLQDLSCIFLERGSPPKVVGIESFSL